MPTRSKWLEEPGAAAGAGGARGGGGQQPGEVLRDPLREAGPRRFSEGQGSVFSLAQSRLKLRWVSVLGNSTTLGFKSILGLSKNGTCGRIFWARERRNPSWEGCGNFDPGLSTEVVCRGAQSQSTRDL